MENKDAVSDEILSTGTLKFAQLKSELNEIQQSFEDSINKFRVKYFIDGTGLVLLNNSKEDKIEIGFAINAYSVKSKL